MIEICNLRNKKMVNVWDVRVDRKSVLGNKFIMHNENERDIVCDKYNEWLEDNVINNDNVRKEMVKLYKMYKKYGKLRLFCWCAPKRCHAESIKNMLERGKR